MTTKCQSCKTEEKRERGEMVSREELTDWMLWGCTCSPEDEASAIAFMEIVTR